MKFFRQPFVRSKSLQASPLLSKSKPFVRSKSLQVISSRSNHSIDRDHRDNKDFTNDAPADSNCKIIDGSSHSSKHKHHSSSEAVHKILSSKDSHNHHERRSSKDSQRNPHADPTGKQRMGPKEKEEARKELLEEIGGLISSEQEEDPRRDYEIFPKNSITQVDKGAPKIHASASSGRVPFVRSISYQDSPLPSKRKSFGRSQSYVEKRNKDQAIVSRSNHSSDRAHRGKKDLTNEASADSNGKISEGSSHYSKHKDHSSSEAVTNRSSSIDIENHHRRRSSKDSHQKRHVDFTGKQSMGPKEKEETRKELLEGLGGLSSSYKEEDPSRDSEKSFKNSFPQVDKESPKMHTSSSSGRKKFVRSKSFQPLPSKRKQFGRSTSFVMNRNKNQAVVCRSNHSAFEEFVSRSNHSSDRAHRENKDFVKDASADSDGKISEGSSHSSKPKHNSSSEAVHKRRSSIDSENHHRRRASKDSRQKRHADLTEKQPMGPIEKEEAGKEWSEELGGLSSSEKEAVVNTRDSEESSIMGTTQVDEEATKMNSSLSGRSRVDRSKSFGENQHNKTQALVVSPPDPSRDHARRDKYVKNDTPAVFMTAGTKANTRKKVTLTSSDQKALGETLSQSRLFLDR